MSDPVLNVRPLGFTWDTEDPFLFCVHHDDQYPRGNAQQGPAASLEGRDLGQDFHGKDGWRMYHGHSVPGFPQHPHRGFETVTLVRRGLIDHSDSLGATARFGGGDVQWLTAGKGIVHCEMFPLVDQGKPNPLELFQIWLNLPAANKMVDPHFSMLWANHIPKVHLTDEQGRAIDLALVAGALGQTQAPPPPPKSWANQPDTDLAIWTIKLAPHAKWVLPAAKAGTNRNLYFFVGEGLTVAGRAIPASSGLKLQPEVAVALEAGATQTELLLLQARPIKEPVSSYGPFVMNTRTEIEQAFADYQRTQFGGWPWPKDDPVHPRESGRFARHADGRVEKQQG